METIGLPRVANKIQLSQAGLEMIRGLPEEVAAYTPTHVSTPYPLASTFNNKRPRIDFHSFANQTQKLLKHSSSSLLTPTKNLHPAQSQRKLQLHHDQWVSQQKLLLHKVADTQARMQQNKCSEYDWKGTSFYLKRKAEGILSEWEETMGGRRQRTQEKLKRLLGKKYPGRG